MVKAKEIYFTYIKAINEVLLDALHVLTLKLLIDLSFLLSFLFVFAIRVLASLCKASETWRRHHKSLTCRGDIEVSD